MNRHDPSVAHVAHGLHLPRQGKKREELKKLMEEARRDDADWRHGKTAGYVFYAGEDILEVAQEAYLMFFSENGLGLKAFPSLKRFETEVVAMIARLLHGDQAIGNMTSGGTESLLLTVKTARDRARVEHPHITEPAIVLPVTAHPAFNKAAHYFGLKVIRTPVREDFRADVSALEAAITENTVLVVGSAPDYSYGVIDPISDLAAIAQERKIYFHVDACMGGFLLPFLEKLGYAIPPFDFRVPGVTSISADIHKYGFGAKGASTLLYRDASIHKYQGFDFQDWPTGLYSSPTIAGTRPGGAIAAAWAVMHYLGEEGYLKLAEKIMCTTTALIQGINQIPELEVWGKPDMSLFAYGSRTLDIYAVADGMSARGWFVNRQMVPPGIHLTVTPAHEPIIDSYLRDLTIVTCEVAQGKLQGQGTPVTYN